MHRHVPVALLETAVLANVMQIVTSDDNRTLHLQLLHNAGENAAANAHVAGERALLVDVGAIDRLQNTEISLVLYNIQLLRGNAVNVASGMGRVLVSLDRNIPHAGS